MATLSASVLLYGALFSGLLLWTDPTDILSQEGGSVIQMRAQIAPTDRGPSKSPHQRDKRVPVSTTKTKSDVSEPPSKTVPSSRSEEVGGKTSAPKSSAPAQTAQTAQTALPSQNDVAQIVTSLISGQGASDPLDFQVLQNGGFSLTVNAPTADVGTPISLGPKSDDTDCQIAQSLQILLQNDPAMKQALSHLPRSQRSVANVIMAWDDKWVGGLDETISDRPVKGVAPTWELLKTQIQAHLHNIPPECLSQRVMGPQFILIDDASEQTVLAFGSGVWRWADLAEPTVPTTNTVSSLVSQILNFQP